MMLREDLHVYELDRLRDRLLTLADDAYEAASKMTGEAAIRAHHRALVLAAAREALIEADCDRAELHARVVSLRSVVVASVTALRDVDTHDARLKANNILGMIGPIPPPYKPMSPRVLP
jgi:hypothetical protein